MRSVLRSSPVLVLLVAASCASPSAAGPTASTAAPDATVVIPVSGMT